VYVYIYIYWYTDIAGTGKKDRRINTWENYYIYRNGKDILHLNDNTALTTATASVHTLTTSSYQETGTIPSQRSAY
jgi:hypothetical protein